MSFSNEAYLQAKKRLQELARASSSSSASANVPASLVSAAAGGDTAAEAKKQGAAASDTGTDNYEDEEFDDEEEVNLVRTDDGDRTLVDVGTTSSSSGDVGGGGGEDDDGDYDVKVFAPPPISTGPSSSSSSSFSSSSQQTTTVQSPLSKPSPGSVAPPRGARAFSLKLDALKQLLVSIFDKFGTSYAVDTKVNAALDQLHTVHVRALRHVQKQLKAAEQARDTTQRAAEELQAGWEAQLHTLRQTEIKRSQTYKTRLARATARAARDARDECAKSFQTELDKAQQQAAANQNRIRELEAQYRARVARELENEQTASAERDAELERKIASIEARAVDSIRKKEHELSVVRSEMQQLKDEWHKWDTQYREERQKAAKVAEQGQAQRVRNVELQAALEESKGAVARLQARVEDIGHSSQADKDVMLTQLRDQVTLTTRAEHRANDLERQLRAQRDQLPRAVASARQRHDEEIAALNLRIRALVNKKDEQIRLLTTQVVTAQSKLVATEQFLAEQNKELSGL